jgi:hypothetical protein
MSELMERRENQHKVNRVSFIVVDSFSYLLTIKIKWAARENLVGIVISR